jgi:hypothetical protein
MSQEETNLVKHVTRARKLKESSRVVLVVVVCQYYSVEKGKESYLTEDDIKRKLKGLRKLVVFHKPEKSRFE